MARNPAPRSRTLPRLSRREQECIDVLFARGSATVLEVQEALADPPGYSAVRATLNILVAKGHAKSEQDGPRYVYRPTVSAGAAQRAAIQHVVSTFFGGSAEQAAAALLDMSDADTSRDIIERLTQRINAARKEGR